MKFDSGASALGMIAVGMSFFQSANAFFRMPCSQPVVVERSDPIVNPGAISGHLHTIMGSSGFNFTEDFAAARAGKCTSCKAKQDRSNYWVPSLFYQAQNGSVRRVDQIGGALIYYLQRTDPNTNEPVKPFPPGFRMLAGDPFLRSYDPNSLAQRAVSFVCLDYSSTSPQSPGIPNRNCPNGLRAQIFFPSCWNGQLDSPDHKSHMAYPSGMDSGTCPSTHPTRLVSIFYELIWDTNPWAGQWWKPNGQHPFVLASGDTTGYGHHGDFLNGWDEAALDKAIKKCTQNSGTIEDCAADLELLSDDEMKDCVKPSRLDEVTTGWLPSLPGCNAITSGPERATPAKDGTCGKNVPNILSADQVGFFKKSVPFWDPVGCAADSLNNRLLPKKFTDPAMTVAKCGTTCNANGFKYAGLQWGVECWCGNTFDESKANLYGSCTQACAGDASEFCGNAGILSVYKYNANKTTGGSTPPPSPNPAPSSTRTSTRASSAAPPGVSSTSVAAPSSNPVPPVLVPAPAPTTSTSTGATPANTNVPAGWNYRGCFVDGLNPRTLNSAGIYYGVPMTPSACTDHCTQRGFMIAGTEYSGECFCGNSMTGGATQKPESECNMPCRGNASIMCGGPGRLSVYTKDMRQLKRDDLFVFDDLEKRDDILVKRNESLASPAHFAKHRRAIHGRSRSGCRVISTSILGFFTTTSHDPLYGILHTKAAAFDIPYQHL